MSSLEGRRERPPLRFVEVIRAFGDLPRVLITTSHRPSKRTRSFIKDLTSAIDGSIRITRGHMSMEYMASLAMEYGIKSIAVMWDRKGNPGLLVGYSVRDGNLTEVARLNIVGVSLSRELGLRARARCKFVMVRGQGDVVEVAKRLANTFSLELTDRPSGDYLEVRDEGVIVVAPHKYPSGEVAPPILRLMPPGRATREL